MRMAPPVLLLAAAVLALPAPAQEPTLGARLRTERTEVERLINELKPVEAQARAEALLPTPRPAFDKATPQTLYMGYATYLSLSQAYHLAFKAANAAGQWEKALVHIKAAQEVARTNRDTIKEPFKLIADNSRAMANRTRATLKENESYIAHLRALKEKDASDLQQLDLVDKENKNIEELDKRAAAFEDFIKTAQADADRYDPFIAYIEKQIQEQEAQIADYKAGKGEKTKWVEAIIANPSTYAAYTDKRDLIGFLYRLSVLDPENRKVQHEIDVVLGKAEPTPVRKPAKGKKR